MGEVTTFYSYKGGGGRSMSLANVAWALASNGLNVLAVDWDLEAPGLHRYFHPFLDDPGLTRTDGLMDHLWGYVGSAVGQGGADVQDWADVSGVAVRLRTPPEMTGSLSLVGAGRQDGRYSERVTGFDWGQFYDSLDGSALVDAIAGRVRRDYDCVLIDSRTGVSDSAGICTVQLPDTVVMTFVYNRQSIEGTAGVARSIRAARAEMGWPVRIIPVPTRVEDRLAAAAARRFAALNLRDLMGGDVDAAERELRISEVRHHAWCAFEEKLAVFEEDPEERGTLLADMHALASKLGPKVVARRFDEEQLALSWRRASFSDPRLADLSVLMASGSGGAADVLLDWAGKALAEPGERPDWLFRLGTACVEASTKMRTTEPTASEALARQGLDLARSSASHGGDAGEIELGRLLLLRADQLHLRGLYAEALSAIYEASDILRGGERGTYAVLLGRALEWQADANEVANSPATSQALLQKALEAYRHAERADKRSDADVHRVLSKIARSLRAQVAGEVTRDEGEEPSPGAMKGASARTASVPSDRAGRGPAPMADQGARTSRLDRIDRLLREIADEDDVVDRPSPSAGSSPK